MPNCLPSYCMVASTLSLNTSLAEAGSVDRVHERGVAADRIGGQEIGVELLRSGGKVGLELVEEAVAVEEDQLHLVGVGGLAVVDLRRLAERGLFRTARPAENGDVGERGRNPGCEEPDRPEEGGDHSFHC